MKCPTYDLLSLNFNCKEETLLMHTVVVTDIICLVDSFQALDTVDGLYTRVQRPSLLIFDRSRWD